MHITITAIPLLLVLIGVTLAEPPAPNYVHSNYDDYRRQGGGHGKGSSYDDGYGGDEEGGSYSSSPDTYENSRRPSSSHGSSDSYDAAPLGDDYGHNELSPERPYSGSQEPMTHSYSGPANGFDHGPYQPGPPSGISSYRPNRFRMPSIMNLFRRRPQKVYMSGPPPGAHASPVMVSYGGPPGYQSTSSSYEGPSSGPHGSSSSSSYGGGPPASYSSGSPSSYSGSPPPAPYSGGQSSSYDGPSSSYGGSSGGAYDSYDRPSKVYGGHAPPRKPAKAYSASGNLYSQSSKGYPVPVKSYDVKPPRQGYAPPPVANQYGIAQKGHSSPAIHNSYGAVGKGYVAPSYSTPSKSRRPSYRPSQEYSSGHEGNRNSGHSEYTPDVYGGGYDMGTSHY